MTPLIRQDDPAAPPDWVPDALDSAWTLLATYPILLALAVAGAGLVVAVAARRFILFWGLRVSARTRTGVDDQLFRISARMVALVVGYLALVAAIQILPIGERPSQIAVRVLVSGLTLQLMRGALKGGRLLIKALSLVQDRFSVIEERTVPLFHLVMTVGVVGIAAYALLQVWNIDAAAWLASAGVVGIAVGFAARDTLANLFAGFFIIADTPYQVGDYIVLDTGVRGAVTRIGIRSTRVLTRDDVEVIVPNSEMANTKIVNQSAGRWVKFRIRLQVGVAYGSDVDAVAELLEGVAVEHGSVCDEPAPRVRMRGFGDSSLDFELLCWVEEPSERGRVSHELYMKIYKLLGEAGIEIPFPQRDLRVRELPEGTADGDLAGPDQNSPVSPPAGPTSAPAEK